MQCLTQQSGEHVESLYSAARAISGTPLRDSFHLGSTIINDYGRPYENGFNSYSGASGYATAGRFTLYLRGEFQGASSATGYSSALAQQLASIDETTNYYANAISFNLDGSPNFLPTPAIPLSKLATIPLGPIASVTNGRVMEAYVSATVGNHIVSFGKQDEWLGPGQGGAFAYSNNAENIYAFRINRIEPLRIPLLSALTGPFRYEFLVGALRGHTEMADPLYELNHSSGANNVTNPGDSWVHVEKVSLRPYKDLEFGFERTAMFGGEGHQPVNLKSFLRSFFSISAGTSAQKGYTTDPGARFGAFDFSWRLPFVRNWLTLYSDSEVHDDISPIDAPRRAAVRPGIYLSHVPGIPRLDLRVEGASTDPPTNRSVEGKFMYWETIQTQGYTNQGQLFGDWMGREDKGGQGWITYHLSGNEWVQAGVRTQKASKDFIPGGTTLNDFSIQAVKRIRKDFQIDGTFTLEHWKAPVYLPGSQTVTSTTIQLTWFPERKIGF